MRRFPLGTKSSVRADLADGGRCFCFRRLR
jgi:hypothetical protein